ncbi:hypothetical protein [Mesorhizobium sp.]|uniref:hypothetical protein n=1 Tax=Mesorhizobium sp. TaxID=1871066 RepID=UPI0025F4382A|nr:hypothetical protein [Mesorhizobium sp.]
MRIARIMPPAISEKPRTRRPGLFAGGFLISFLSPEAATFFAVTLMGLMLPILDSGEALMVAVEVAIFDIGWYRPVAVLLSRPAVRAVAMRRHGVIEAVLAILALLSAPSAFSSN